MLIDSDPPLSLVRELFREYGQAINVEIDERNPQYELILVAMDGVAAAGCAAMRGLEPGIAEMKRLYVRQAYRGTGLGRTLANSIIEEARGRGYASLRLDTLPFMHSAISMYASLGFRPIPAYHDKPLPGMIYFELELNSARTT